MTKQNLDLLIVRGSSAIRGEGANFRYLTDFPNINIPLVLIFFKQRIQMMRFKRRHIAGRDPGRMDRLLFWVYPIGALCAFELVW